MAFSYSYAALVGTLAGSNGTDAGASLVGRAPGQTLRVVGATSVATVTSGATSGTAGAGTSATSVAKPTGASNWTAADLVGKWLKVTGGAGVSSDGSPVLRPILSNTTTTLAVNTVPGMDNTTTFEIVDLATAVGRISAGDLVALRAQACLGPVEIYGLAFSGAHALDGLLELTDCASVKVEACKLDQNTTNPAISALRCTRLQVNHCRLTSASDVKAAKCAYVSMVGNVNAGGGVVEIEDAVTADVTKMTSDSAPSRVLSMTRVHSATAELAASNGGATPVYLEACSNFEAVGGCLTGSSNTGYGVEIARSGRYVLTGSNVAGGTGDVLFMGNAETWTNLSSPDYGIAEEHAGSAVAHAAYTKSLKRGAVLYYDEVNFSSRVLEYGVHNPGQATGITAAGTTAGDATQLGTFEFHRVDTVASGTGVKLHNAAALPGPIVRVYNAGANALKIYPNNSGTIDGGASITLAAGAIVTLCVVDTAYKAWLTV